MAKNPLVSKPQNNSKGFSPVTASSLVVQDDFPINKAMISQEIVVGKINNVVYVKPTESIQSAIDSLPATGGTVFINAGTYNISSRITVSKENTQIIGEGNSTILILNNSVNDHIFYVTADNVKISNFKIEANGTNQTTGTTIYLDSVENILIEKLDIKDSKQAGIGLYHVENSKILNNKIYNVQTYSIVLSLDCHKNVISNNFCDTSASIGIGCGAYATTPSTYNLIINNTIKTTTDNSIDLNGSHHNSVIGNIIYDCSDAGIDLDSAPDNLIANNNLYDITNHGIIINVGAGGNADRTHIIGNRIEHVNTGNGILIHTSDYVTVSNNYIYDVYGGASYAGIAILASDYGNINDNYVRSVSGWDIVFTGNSSYNNCNDNNNEGTIKIDSGSVSNRVAFNVGAISDSGTTTNLGNSFNGLYDTSLTASKPVFTDANKKLSSSGTVPVANGGTGATTFTNNRVLTGNGTSAIVDEANLTFDGNKLTVANTATGTNQPLTVNDAGTAFQQITTRTRGSGTGTGWRGRIVAGGDACCFLMGQFNTDDGSGRKMAWLGAHNDAMNAWNEFYINPDGSESLHLGYNGVNGGAPDPVLTIYNGGGGSSPSLEFRGQITGNSPSTPGTVAAWQEVIHDGATYYMPLYQ